DRLETSINKVLEEQEKTSFEFTTEDFDRFHCPNARLSALLGLKLDFLDRLKEVPSEHLEHRPLGDWIVTFLRNNIDRETFTSTYNNVVTKELLEAVGFDPLSTSVETIISRSRNMQRHIEACEWAEIFIRDEVKYHPMLYPLTVPFPFQAILTNSWFQLISRKDEESECEVSSCEVHIMNLVTEESNVAILVFQVNHQILNDARRLNLDNNEERWSEIVSSFRSGRRTAKMRKSLNSFDLIEGPVATLTASESSDELFKSWIALSTGQIPIQWIVQLVSLILIHWIVIYQASVVQTLDSAIHPDKSLSIAFTFLAFFIDIHYHYRLFSIIFIIRQSEPFINDCLLLNMLERDCTDQWDNRNWSQLCSLLGLKLDVLDRVDEMPPEFRDRYTLTEWITTFLKAKGELVCSTTKSSLTRELLDEIGFDPHCKAVETIMTRTFAGNSQHHVEACEWAEIFIRDELKYNPTWSALSVNFPFQSNITNLWFQFPNMTKEDRKSQESPRHVNIMNRVTKESRAYRDAHILFDSQAQDLCAGRQKRDFSCGSGFYLTRNLGDALDWAKSTTAKPAILAFQVDSRLLDNSRRLNLFEHEDRWREIVSSFRLGQRTAKTRKSLITSYDFIEGPIATLTTNGTSGELAFEPRPSSFQM
ncbi:unnamed protein product, partial [Porites evermanni]